MTCTWVPGCGSPEIAVAVKVTGEPVAPWRVAVAA